MSGATATTATTAAAPLSGAAIAKRLASCNPAARLRAVRFLTSHLSSSPSPTFSDAELLNIWKGLFYCVWHADKPPAQLDLATRLAALLPSLPPPLAARYLSAFLATVRREWPGIDYHRLDKFYLLLRRFVRHTFLLLAKHSWIPEITSSIATLLLEKSLLANDKHPAQGVNYHIAEVFLDELADFLPVTVSTFTVLVQPFFAVLAVSPDKVMISKIKENVFVRLLQSGAKYLEMEGVEGEKLGKVALAAAEGFAKKFFELASSEGTPQGNRKVLFGLHAGFLKLEKDLEKSGVDVTIKLSSNASLSNLKVEVAEDQQPAKKKRKKSSKGSDTGEKKSKTKKRTAGTTDATMSNGSGDTVSGTQSDSTVTNGSTVADAGNVEAANGGVLDGHNLIAFDEPVISNLQKQFEKVAEEAGMASGKSVSDLATTPSITTTKKKRKRAKSVERQVSPASPNVVSVGLKSGEKSSKKVSFSMKSNIVWKPQTPLPPQSLRLPPSATPRGSALKKGLAPGPIKVTPLKKGNSKSSSAKKKARKALKAVSPSVKRLRKKQTLSA